LLDVANNRFGTDGTMSIEGPTVGEDFKIPHLRNMYQKVGMFSRNVDIASAANLGDQIRGFGFDKSGSSGTVDVFLTAPVFASADGTPLSSNTRKELEQFVLAMPSNMAPIVGQQLTVNPANAAQSDVSTRLDELVAHALVTSPRPECELVAKAVLGNQAMGWVMNRSGSFIPDRVGDEVVTRAALLTKVGAAGSAVTFTCAPPGNGTRMGIDRDGNSVLDRN
jgi:hypothetical protein